MDRIEDRIAHCGNTMPHDPHLWFDREEWPNGNRCFGVTERDAEDRPASWPPKMECKDMNAGDDDRD